MTNLEERKKFLDMYNFPRVNQEEIENMNRPITSNEIESIRGKKKKKQENLPANKRPGSDVYTGKFYQTFSKDLTPILLKLLGKKFQMKELYKFILRPVYHPDSKTKQRYHTKNKSTCQYH